MTDGYTSQNVPLTLTINQPSPNNNLTAMKMEIGTAGSFLSGAYRLVTTAIVSGNTFSICAKKGTSDWIGLSHTGASEIWAYFNISTGVPGYYVGCTPVITDIGNGWYRCSLVNSSFSGNSYALVSLKTSNVNSHPWSTPQSFLGGENIYIWGADLRPTNAGALLPPYQRVNTASDYDSVGFPLYLKCNGLQSAMSTNSIDFTATDKMTVVTGVRKLSDVAPQGINTVMELSISTGPNTGAFFIAAPRNGNAGNYGFLTMGTNVVDLFTPTNYAAPISNVVTGIASISTPLATLRVNGSQVVTSSSTQGTGTYGNFPLYLFARGTSAFYLNGQFYGAIVRGAQSDTASVTQTENYMAQKTGITF